MSYVFFLCFKFEKKLFFLHIKGDPWNIFTTVSTSPMAISQWVLHKTFASAWPTFLAAVGWLCLRFAYRFRSPPPRSHSLSLFQPLTYFCSVLRVLASPYELPSQSLWETPFAKPLSLSHARLLFGLQLP